MPSDFTKEKQKFALQLLWSSASVMTAIKITCSLQALTCTIPPKNGNDKDDTKYMLGKHISIQNIAKTKSGKIGMWLTSICSRIIWPKRKHDDLKGQMSPCICLWRMGEKSRNSGSKVWQRFKEFQGKMTNFNYTWKHFWTHYSIS